LAISLSLTACSRSAQPRPMRPRCCRTTPWKSANIRRAARQELEQSLPRRPSDGIGLVTSIAAHEERILKPDEVLEPWPNCRIRLALWRVVAFWSTPGRKFEQDKIAIRRNRGIVAGELQGAHVAIEWQRAPVPEVVLKIWCPAN